MDIKSKLDKIAIPDTKWIAEATYRQENRYWLRVSFEIAMAVLQALREKGITQREFAGLMGCSPQYISKIVKGSENLTLETICKMEKVLQIKLIETPFSHLHDEKHSSQAGQ